MIADLARGCYKGIVNLCWQLRDGPIMKATSVAAVAAFLAAFGIGGKATTSPEGAIL